MSIKIPGLLEVISLPKVVEVLHDALSDYPKMENTFTDREVRLNALDASLWFYCAYDMYYGKAYTLDKDVNEVVLVVDSKNMSYSKARLMKAGAYSLEYQEAKEKLEVEDRKKRLKLFKELDKLEKSVPLPNRYLYIDFLGVVGAKQGEGRGRQLMEKVCAYADDQKLPIMLFTNTDGAEKFYERLGFHHVKTTVSEKFGFKNVYLIRDPQ